MYSLSTPMGKKILNLVYGHRIIRQTKNEPLVYITCCFSPLEDCNFKFFFSKIVVYTIDNSSFTEG